MDELWVLILKTFCPGAGSVDAGAEQGQSSFPAEAQDEVSDTTITWRNHTSIAFVQCDIALFPDDLTLSRQEFLASVWRMPAQLLYPCGAENLLLFPPMNISEYHIAISDCSLQPTILYSESLHVSAALPSQTRVSWKVLGEQRGLEAVMIPRVEVELHLADARSRFNQGLIIAAVMEEKPLFDSVTYPGIMAGNQTEVRLLLDSLRGEIVRVDRFLTFIMISSTFLLICLIKVAFFEDSSASIRRKEEYSNVRFSPAARPPQSLWLAAAGQGTTMAYQTPHPQSTRQSLWSLPTTGATARVPTNQSLEASPCEELALEWKHKKEARRRNRRADIGPRRLIAPGKVVAGDATTSTDRIHSTEGKISSKPPQALLVPEAVTKNKDDITDEGSKAKETNPEELVRRFWSFGTA